MSTHRTFTAAEMAAFLSDPAYQCANLLQMHTAVGRLGLAGRDVNDFQKFSAACGPDDFSRVQDLAARLRQIHAEIDAFHGECRQRVLADL